MQNIYIALGLTLFAGLATGIGSMIAFMAKRTNYRFLAIATGFSAGVMLYVSFVEILFKGNEALVNHYGDFGNWINALSFFSGIALIGLIDALIPHAENPHEAHTEFERAPLREPDAPIPSAKDLEMKFTAIDKDVNSKKLLRMGLFTALAIAIHNFPEGLATFLAALEDPSLGVAIAVAIALHNIPEGISVSVPIFYATGNRKKAFFWSFLSGLAEPVGAIIGYTAIKFFVGDDSGIIPQNIMGILFGAVAGIMVYISLDELLPTSRAYGKGHDSIIGLVVGMFVMSLSLLLM
ncbi:MAG: zinc transporter ZupT [Verrucomicrobiota bacterium]|nr:zinc transporter ZupT [Kiritimatiellaceae bacterium]MEC7107669.1 zinc transporter ZupT [Verrucomicrobiota bacterium]MEC8313531.1 zinc transporter ZupT [Verrucomicrobiota bacterium]|tara:strand:- start:2540 stop:3421 length:882 start_codon:yes stop_codon:yes gene_type:complete